MVRMPKDTSVQMENPNSVSDSLREQSPRSGLDFAQHDNELIHIRPNEANLSSNGPSGPSFSYFEELAYDLIQEPYHEVSTKITKGEKASGISTSCPNSQQNTIVIMDGVTITVSHAKMLKSLRPLPKAKHKKVPDYDLESDDSMEENDL